MSLLRCVLLLLCLALAGCDPRSRGQADEQRESYFLVAKKRLQERDYDGAIEYFEKAVHVNPRSASAHFELGVLFEQQQNDYASALYHYQKTISLRPDIAAADIIRQRIEQCKREIAKSVVTLPSLENLQREVDRLRVENEQLKRTLKDWQNYYAGRGASPSNAAPAAASALASARSVAVTNAARPAATRADTFRPAPAPVAARTHRIIPGDTLARIARQYGVNLSALQSANPRLDPRRLRPGDTITIPAR